MNRAGRGGRSPNSAAARRGLRRGPEGHAPQIVLGRANVILLLAGVVAVVAGFLLLAGREITLSPILLVGGYCILVPLGLLYRPRTRAPGANSSAG